MVVNRAILYVVYEMMLTQKMMIIADTQFRHQQLLDEPVNRYP